MRLGMDGTDHGRCTCPNHRAFMTTELVTPVALRTRDEDSDFALRTAACLGALGFSPHEVQCIVATELNVDQHVVAEMLRSGPSSSVCSVA